MPNIRSQILNTDGITIVASNGKTFSVTRSEIRTNFLSQNGNLASRRTKTIQWLKDNIVSSLGSEQFDFNKITADFSESDGSPTRLEVEE